MKKNTALRLLSAFAILTILFAACDKTDNPKEKDPTENPEPEKPEEPDMNSYILDDEQFSFGSVALVNIGENIGLAACPSEDVASYDDILAQDEYFFIGISPLLNGDKFDMKTESKAFTVISTLDGAQIEEVSPEYTDEILSGDCQFEYSDGTATVEISMSLADGTSFKAKLSAEESEIIINENTITRNGEEKPVRAAFFMEEEGMTYLYLTPAGIDYGEELEIASYYFYLALETSKCDGSTLGPDGLLMAGIVDNASGTTTDSSEDKTSGSVSVKKSTAVQGQYSVIANLVIGSESIVIAFEGEAKDYLISPEETYEVIYDGTSYQISEVTLDKTVGEDLWTVTIKTTGEDVTITLPSSAFDGNAWGFSQFQKNPEVMVKYGETVYNKASGASGTITVGIDGGTIRIEFTNYDNFEVLYEGPFTIIG